jgi:hypothetical protein
MHSGPCVIMIHDTRRTCGSLLVALDVHPRIATAILRHSRSTLTMEIYTQVPDKVTRDTLRRLSDWLGRDQGGDAASDPLADPCCCTSLLYRGMQEAGPEPGTGL